MSDKEKSAYLAGIVDGEGTITITRHAQHGRKTYQYKPFIYVSNTDKRLIDFLVKEFKGRGFANVLKLRKKDRKIPLRWRVMSLKGIDEILSRILSYLIVKKEQALILRRYLKSRFTLRSKNWWAGYTHIEHECYLKIRKLNKRAVV